MTVIGCLLPLLLTIAGSVLGAILGGGATGAWWGAGGGFVLGCIGMAGLIWGSEWIMRIGGYDTRE